MRHCKYVVAQYCFYDRTGIQKMLEKQAKKGWMLESIGPLGWKYRKEEPKEVRYAVTYYPNASQFDPYPTAGERLYQDYAAHSGWQFVASNAQLQIFLTEELDPVPMETEPLVELRNIHKAVVMSYLPGYFLMTFCALLNLGLMSWRLWENFTGTLASNANIFSICCWTLLAGMEVWEIIAYFTWRRKAMKAAELDGSFVETRNRNNVIWLIVAVVSVGLILTLWSVEPAMVWASLVFPVLALAAAGLVLGFTAWMKKNRFPKEDNRAYTIMAAVLAAVVVTSLATWGVNVLLNDLPGENGRDSCAFYGFTVTRSGEDLPLSAAEVIGGEAEDYSLYKTVESSLLIRRLVVNQYPCAGSDAENGLRYVVVDVKLPVLFRAALDDYLRMYHDKTMTDIFGDEFYGDFRPVEPGSWQADQAWQLYRLEEGEQEYLLVYGNRIVNIEFGEVPDQQQITAVIRSFGNEQKFENTEK